MIAIAPDTDVPTTLVQRVAARVLVGFCVLLGAGVISSVVRLSAAQPPVEASATRPRFMGEQEAASGQLSAMAAARSTNPSKPAPAEVELVHSTSVSQAVEPGQPRVVWMLVTAYCPCAKCCGHNAMGLTASGKPTTTNYGHFVAAPTGFPFGSKLVVPGYNRGRAVPVLDRGGAIKGSRLDVFFPSHDQAKAWGRRWVSVTIQG